MLVVSEQLKRNYNECQICGAPAYYTYYGAIACEPCKIFFRRTVTASRIGFAPVCKILGRCEVKKQNRHNCAACRLTKCFQAGMSTDRLRGPIQNKRMKKSTVEDSFSNQGRHLSTISLLRSDQSSLTKDQWTLLTNLYHCYQESSIVPFIQRLGNTNPSDQITSGNYGGFVDEFLVSVYETAGSYMRFNDDIRRLSFNNRSIVVRNAADNVCCMGGAFIMQHYQLYSVPYFLHVMREKYGRQTMDIHNRARKFIDSDIVMIKLALAMFALSENTGCYTTHSLNDLNNSIHIFEVQSRYAEVAWKYLLYRYGQNRAVKQFLNLILFFISMNNLTAHAQSLVTHLQDIDSIIEKTEIELIIHDVDEINEKN